VEQAGRKSFPLAAPYSRNLLRLAAGSPLPSQAHVLTTSSVYQHTQASKSAPSLL
jgi:hypothetical protein